MNILFISIIDFDSLEERSLYTDLLRALAEVGHRLACVSPVERRSGKKASFLTQGSVRILKPLIGNIQKTRPLAKGLALLFLERQLIRAIKRHLPDRFDLALYLAPPVTLNGVIDFIKRRDGTATYLMLKDIFPQNAIDLGLIKKGGFFHRYYAAREKRLYELSDHIGCMTPANVRFVVEHNPWLAPGRVGLCPNTITPGPLRAVDRPALRAKYHLPPEAVTFIYGGNLGRPQGVDFIIQALKSQIVRPDRSFVICGSGTEFGKLQKFLLKIKPGNIFLFPQQPKEEFEDLAAACDIGLIFLDHRFTIPNFPSRLLSYLENGLPVLAATDQNTDLRQVINEGGFGWWCESKNPDDFAALVEKALAMKAEFPRLGRLARAYLENNYRTEVSLKAVLAAATAKEAVDYPAFEFTAKVAAVP